MTASLVVNRSVKNAIRVAIGLAMATLGPASMIVAGWLTTTSPALAQALAKPALGPLRVHPDNPRYFTDGSGKAVYLTGSHVWNTLQDQGTTYPPPPFDFNGYLDFLNQHGHNFINEYQAGKAKQHSVGMTSLAASSAVVSNDALFASPADWVSPGLTVYGPSDLYSINPPAAKGKKVEILDTDHTWNNAWNPRISRLRADHAWVWKSFLRGYNPIYMDPLDLTEPDGVMEYAKANAYAVILARPAMGHTRAYAETMNLAAMTPRDDLASTRYCLADPAKEYMIYLPDGGDVTVDLSAAKGTLAVEWFNPRTGDTQAGDKIDGGGERPFRAPFDGDAVLYLHKP